MDSQGCMKWRKFERVNVGIASITMLTVVQAMNMIGFSKSTGSGSRVTFKSKKWGTVRFHQASNPPSYVPIVVTFRILQMHDKNIEHYDCKQCIHRL